MKMQVHDNLAEAFCQYAGYWKEEIRIKWMNSYLH